MDNKKDLPIKISAIGDISFMGKVYEKSLVNPLKETYTLFEKSDFLVANLESPLILNGDPIHRSKCTLHGSPTCANMLKQVGINVVSLSNNHMMDYGQKGLWCTIEALKSEGILYVGAGQNIEQACQPIFIEHLNKRIAILSRTSVIVSAQIYATETKPGVAFFDISEITKNIQSCRKYSDIVILLIHWGLEEYLYPSPHQRAIARKLVNAGVDVILGHHPHVLQGIETINNGIVSYSLGNFMFNEFMWSFINKEGQRQNSKVTLTKENRKGVILNINISENGIESYKYFPTFINHDGIVEIDENLNRRKQIDNLSIRLQWPMYNFFWRLYSIKKEWDLRIIPLFQGKFTWSKIKKIRLKHFKLLIYKMSHSAKITSEKTTDPYSYEQK